MINADTTKAARDCHENLWDKARFEAAVVLLSPEELKSPAFRGLTDDPTLVARIMALNVDEVHLLGSWSEFREAFKGIGIIRVRLPITPVLIALTATLCPGEQTTTVCNSLGLRHYHLIRRSNARYDIKWVFRTMHSGPKSYTFPELDWILSDGRRGVVFCDSISLSQRVYTYLWNKNKSLVDHHDRIRIFTALGPDSYSKRTLELLRNTSDMRSRITVGTDTMAHGLDASTTTDVISFGFIPKDVNLMVQRAGRICDGRDCGACYAVYLPRNAAQRAEKTLAHPSHTQLHGRQAPKRKAPGGQVDDGLLDRFVARVILAPCKIAELDAIFDNPATDETCTCPTCWVKPAIPRPVPCTCSGCSPESRPLAPAPGGLPAPEGQGFGECVVQACDEGSHSNAELQSSGPEDELRSDGYHDGHSLGTVAVIVPDPTPVPTGHLSHAGSTSKKTHVRGALKVTKKMRVLGLNRLETFRRGVWELGDDTQFSDIYPSSVLPNHIINMIFDNFNSAVGSLDTLQHIIASVRYLRGHEAALFAVLQELKVEFEAINKHARETANAKRRATVQAMKAAELASGHEPSSQSAGRIRIPGGVLFQAMKAGEHFYPIYTSEGSLSSLSPSPVTSSSSPASLSKSTSSTISSPSTIRATTRGCRSRSLPSTYSASSMSDPSDSASDLDPSLSISISPTTAASSCMDVTDVGVTPGSMASEHA